MEVEVGALPDLGGYHFFASFAGEVCGLRRHFCNGLEEIVWNRAWGLIVDGSRG